MRPPGLPTFRSLERLALRRAYPTYPARPTYLPYLTYPPYLPYSTSSPR
jgi:hypothetical protein